MTRSAPKTGFSFHILRSTIVFIAFIIDSIDYINRRLRNRDIVSSSFISNLAHFPFASLRNSSRYTELKYSANKKLKKHFLRVNEMIFDKLFFEAF